MAKLKINMPTKAGFKKFLQKNLSRKFVQGECAKCPVAKYTLELNPEVDEVEVGPGINFFVFGQGVSPDECITRKLPSWARKFIETFDDFEFESTTVTAKKILANNLI